MDAVHPSLENFGLHRAAAAGDDDELQYALRSGADVNALDAAGKTALMCAIAGNDWQNVDPSDASFMTRERMAAIRALLNDSKISLLTLNAPHNSMNGVVPLGMAAWLNLPSVVRLLLEESADTISVDGMDSHGATALMYAARDGNLEVVQLLLSHGARPDFRDSNYRTSIQFALPHHQILWLCESVLRRHRWRELASADRARSLIPDYILELSTHSLPSSDDLDPPPASIFTPGAISRLLDTLISSVRSNDLSFIHSLLFSPAIPPSSPACLYPMSVPVLVNLPDAKGWSLIHHALAAKFPSVDLLDSLYCAGADMALFTTNEQWTPLHILAQSQTLSPGNLDHDPSLHELVTHLVRDLRAPLSARDKNDDTCIHIAAERGSSLDLLACLLDLDKSGAVRQLKNSRGLTAMQTAKPEFLVAFGPDAGILQLITTPAEALSSLQNGSFASLSDASDLFSQDDSSSICSPSNLDIALTTQQLLTNLRLSSPSGKHTNDPSHLRHLESIMAEARQHQEALVEYFRDRVKEIEREMEQLKKNTGKIGSLRSSVADSARAKSMLRGVRMFPPKRYHRDSEDSRASTVVSSIIIDENAFSPEVSPIDSPVQPFDTLKPISRTKKISLIGRSSFGTLSGLFDRSSSILSYHARADEGLGIMDQYSNRDSRLLNCFSTPDLREGKDDSKKKRARPEKEPATPEKKGSGSPTVTTPSRLKAWFKRIVTSTSHQDLQVAQARPSFGAPQTASSTDRHPPQLRLEVPAEEAAPRPSTVYLTPSDILGQSDATIDGALQTSAIVLDAARRDLQHIHACLSSAQQFIDLAHHSVTKVERATKRALKKRRAMIAKLRESVPGTFWQDGDVVNTARASPGLLGYTAGISLRPSVASIYSIHSTHSSVASAAATITEHDDEDTRVVRRLLLRKIDAQTSGAWDEIEKIATWHRVLKEVIRGVKRRAYL